MKRQQAEKPFEDYWVYPPRLHEKQNRYYTVLINKENQKIRRTITYAKYLLSIKLGRILLKSEQVDHINNDKMDDRIENLQVLTQKENSRKSAPKPKTIELICDFCGNKFIRRNHINHLRWGAKKAYCKKECLYNSQRKINNLN